jgi:hypothetical protein
MLGSEQPKEEPPTRKKVGPRDGIFCTHTTIVQGQQGKHRGVFVFLRLVEFIHFVTVVDDINSFCCVSSGNV